MDNRKKEEKNEHTKKETLPDSNNSDVSGNEQEEKKGIWQQISDVAEKGADVLKTGAEKVAHFTSSSAKLAKLKIEVHNLQNDCNERNLEAGRKLWQIKKDNKLGNVKTLFAEDFKKMASLRKEIAAKEKELSKISLVE